MVTVKHSHLEDIPPTNLSGTVEQDLLTRQLLWSVFSADLLHQVALLFRHKQIKHSQEARGLGRSQLSNACSRASSDAGSVLNSLLGTPKHRQLTGAQEHHTLQAVASRLQQQAQDCCLTEHATPDSLSPPVSIHGDPDCHTTRWIQEHVSPLARPQASWTHLGKGLRANLQVQWEQQNPDQLLQHEMNQKKAMQQLSGAVQCLEDKLDVLMTAQSVSSEDWRIGCKMHTAASARQNSSCAAAGIYNVTKTSPSAAEAPESCHVTDLQLIESAYCNSKSHAEHRCGMEPSCSSQQMLAPDAGSLTGCKASVQPVSSTSKTGACSSEKVQLCSASLIYTQWLNAIAAVEAASLQLRKQTIDPTESNAFASYACLLQSQPNTGDQ